MIQVQEYQVTRYARAKHLRLRVNSLGKILVTAPKHVSDSIVSEFVHDNLEWIASAISAQKDVRLSHPDLGLQMPTQVNLRSIDTCFQVSEINNKKNYYSEQANFLYIYGENSEIRLAGLRQWLKDKARLVLPEYLAQQAQEMGLSYNKISVKNQKTRWGSCSSNKNINLNQNLLFVNRELLDYLLIHELTHLDHPNHSAHFWRAVAMHDADYRTHDKQLNKVVKTLPLWALPFQN